MTSIAGLYGYFSSLDRDGSGFLEKDEVECKFFFLELGPTQRESEKKVNDFKVILVLSQCVTTYLQHKPTVKLVMSGLCA